MDIRLNDDAFEEQRSERSKTEQKIAQDRAFGLFNTSQCSWCRLFYTQPFLCVLGKLHSNCSFFQALSEEERRKAQAEEREWSWSWRAYDMVLRVEQYGVLGRCRECGALNPNPDKDKCWRCGEDLSCPNHKGSILRYDILRDFWKCLNTACRTSYTWCPVCGHATLTHVPMGLWECTRCHAFGSNPKMIAQFNSRILPAQMVDKQPQEEAKDDKSAHQEEYREEPAILTSDIPSKFQVDINSIDKAEHSKKTSIETEKSRIGGTLIRNSPKSSHDNKTTKNQNNITINTPIPNWLKALLLIFTFSFVGLVINTFVGSSIPFWILFGFSTIYSIEKWFSYFTRKYKWFGRLYKLILNLGILSLFGLLIWSGIKLFSHQFLQNVFIGSILFIAEFVFFIWLWRVVSKNSWRWPSIKLTIFTLICLFLVFTFAGVQPMSSYKDTALNKIQATFSNNNSQPVTKYSTNLMSTPLYTTPPVTTIAHTNVITTPSQTSPIVQTIALGINFKTGVYKNYYLGLVNSSEGVVGGDGCYDAKGDFIVLINNKDATDPTYAQLINFLQNDKTDQYPYIYTNRGLTPYYPPAESHVDLKNIQNIIDGITQPSNPDVCSDFAERLHNDAEMAGIRCAYVCLDISGYSDPNHLGIPSNTSHACNAFQTTDRGLVYVDDTGMSSDTTRPSRLVSTVNITVGQEYIRISLFPEVGWQSAFESGGTVTDMLVIWDGTWNN